MTIRNSLRASQQIRDVADLVDLEDKGIIGCEQRKWVESTLARNCLKPFTLTVAANAAGWKSAYRPSELVGAPAHS